MGMFDNIKFSYPCPVCGNMTYGYQSKDNDPCLITRKLTEVNRFYTSCDICESWIEFLKQPDNKYKMILPKMNKFEKIKTKEDMYNQLMKDDVVMDMFFYCLYKINPIKKEKRNVK